MVGAGSPPAPGIGKAFWRGGDGDRISIQAATALGRHGTGDGDGSSGNGGSACAFKSEQ